MKKSLLFYIVFIMFIGFATPVFAAEETPFFGVGAKVEKVEDGVFSVKTEGAKENEGFVFSPKGLQTGETVVFEVELKGDVAIYLNVDETDPRGTFLAETVSPVISLHDAWRTIQLEVELQETTSQIDAMVLTNKKETTEFMFRNARVFPKREGIAP